MALRALHERDLSDTGEAILVGCVDCGQQVDVMAAHYDHCLGRWICTACLTRCDECDAAQGCIHGDEGDEDAEDAAAAAS